MTDVDEQTKLFIEISRNLGEINSKLGSLCETIARHELRLTELEKMEKVRDGKSNFKDEVVHLLVKGLILAIGTIATMVGAGALLKPLFGL